MLVYGDARRRLATADRLRAVARGGPEAFFDASGLAQGLIDEEFRRLGADDLTPLHAACLELLGALVRGAGAAEALARLQALPLPAEIEVTTPEGYAFYAVYPEAYARAAKSVGWSRPPLVIGLRSIGTGLAAVAAEATGGAALTLRPVSHPFRREVKVSEALRQRLAAHPGEFAVVDEGPGLSGSSFAAVAELLASVDVPPRRIVFFPSHPGGPGPQADASVLSRWSAVRQVVASSDHLLTGAAIAERFADVLGSTANAEDMSAGAWRGPSSRMPADPPRERRKIRLTAAGGTYVARFAGLGGIGEAKLGRAERLHAGGFQPEPLALRDGFLLQRWETGAPLAARDRDAFLRRLACYIAFRAQAFPAGDEPGATPEELARMIEVNLGLKVDPPAPGPRLHIDGRLHAWEWLRRPDGAFCKLDALDHSCAHDLVGCQPAEYDVAGAIVEFGLSPAESRALMEGLAAADGPAIDTERLRFFLLAYTGFQFGLWSLAEPTPEVLLQRSRYAPGKQCRPL